MAQTWRDELSQLIDLQGQYTIPCCIPASLLDSHASNIIIWSTASDGRNERSVVRPRGYCCQSKEEYNTMNGVSASYQDSVLFTLLAPVGVGQFATPTSSSEELLEVGRASRTFYTRPRPEGLSEGIPNKHMSKSMSAFRTFGDTLVGTPSIVQSQWVGPG